MKVLLIQPPFTIFRNEFKKCHPPLGLAYLAAWLKDDHDILILDCLAEGYSDEIIIDKEFLQYGLPFVKIKEQIRKISPEVVGISCLFSSQIGNVIKICQIVKEINSNIITVLGGAHPSALPEEVLKNKAVDFVIIGEGENILKSLLESIEKNKDLRNINNIGFKLDGKISLNSKVEPISDIDNFPFPYWDIFPLDKYFQINNPHGSPARRIPFLPMITSRGCPFECIFCSVHNLWGRGYRARSPKNVLEEIDFLKKRFGIREIIFEDDNLTLEKSRAIAIFQGIIDRNYDLSWNVPNGVAVKTLDEEMLMLIKESGCYRLSVGVESGDESVLKNIVNKSVNLLHTKRIISMAKNYGLETVAFFVVGLPGEKKEQLRNTFRFAESLDADVINLFFATPLPGTKLFEMCKNRGLISNNMDYVTLKSDYPNFDADELTKEALMSCVYREKLKLYFLFFLRNPRIFFYKIVNKIINEPMYFIKFWRRYFKIRK